MLLPLCTAAHQGDQLLSLRTQHFSSCENPVLPPYFHTPHSQQPRNQRPHFLSKTLLKSALISWLNPKAFPPCTKKCWKVSVYTFWTRKCSWTLHNAVEIMSVVQGWSCKILPAWRLEGWQSLVQWLKPSTWGIIVQSGFNSSVSLSLVL